MCNYSSNLSYDTELNQRIGKAAAAMSRLTEGLGKRHVIDINEDERVQGLRA